MLARLTSKAVCTWCCHPSITLFICLRADRTASTTSVTFVLAAKANPRQGREAYQGCDQLGTQLRLRSENPQGAEENHHRDGHCQLHKRGNARHTLHTRITASRNHALGTVAIRYASATRSGSALGPNVPSTLFVVSQISEPSLSRRGSQFFWVSKPSTWTISSWRGRNDSGRLSPVWW